MPNDKIIIVEIFRRLCIWRFQRMGIGSKAKDQSITTWTADHTYNIAVKVCRGTQVPLVIVGVQSFWGYSR